MPRASFLSHPAWRHGLRRRAQVGALLPALIVSSDAGSLMASLRGRRDEHRMIAALRDLVIGGEARARRALDWVATGAVLLVWGVGDDFRLTAGARLSWPRGDAARAFERQCPTDQLSNTPVRAATSTDECLSDLAACTKPNYRIHAIFTSCLSPHICSSISVTPQLHSIARAPPTPPWTIRRQWIAPLPF